MKIFILKMKTMNYCYIYVIIGKTQWNVTKIQQKCNENVIKAQNLDVVYIYIYIASLEGWFRK